MRWFVPNYRTIVVDGVLLQFSLLSHTYINVYNVYEMHRLIKLNVVIHVDVRANISSIIYKCEYIASIHYTTDRINE